eukprot:6212171-Pleurochrysis_carterae.AAC.1
MNDERVEMSARHSVFACHCVLHGVFLTCCVGVEAREERGTERERHESRREREREGRKRRAQGREGGRVGECVCARAGEEEREERTRADEGKLEQLRASRARVDLRDSAPRVKSSGQVKRVRNSD